jgi:hypothetical protein
VSRIRDERRLSVRELEILCWRNDVDSAKFPQYEKIFVSGYDDIGVGPLGTLEKHVVVSVSADRELTGDLNPRCAGKGFTYRHSSLDWLPFEFMNQDAQ